MKTGEYMRHARDLFDSGKISAEVYDAIVQNADIFCDDDDDDDCDDPRFPDSYAEIEYDDFDDPEAILGSRFDDMNFLRHFER